MQRQGVSSHRRWFWLGCLIEAALIGVAAGLAKLFGRPWLADLRLDGWAVGWGGAGAMPLLGLFWWMLRSAWPPLVEVRQLLENNLRPIFQRWSWWELGLICLLAGLGEELLFRGALHGGLAGWVGEPAAWVAASVLFGLCHAVTRSYALIAALIGAYLSALWVVTGNLLVPVVAHGLYDFLALAYFLHLQPRVGRQGQGAGPTSTA